ncbi:MAG TPA: Rieske (2Fe-2S) protein [Methylomirabilota bacterium]|nr:Rieske (2Fe-2S) protein [Methylomirabilota bacterium]
MEQTLEPGPTRRGFVNWWLGTSAGAFLLSVLYPVTRYLVPPPVAESTSASVTLPFKADEVKPNSGQTFKFGNRPGILVRSASGELKAFSAVCTHLNCTVQYRPDLAHIWCACHNGHFDLNGQNIEGPPPRPLDAFVVNVRGAQIVVSKST